MGEQFLLSKDKAKNTLPRENTGLARKQNQSRNRDRSKQKPRRGHNNDTQVPEGMERYRIEGGHQNEGKPSNIVGALANESGLDGDHIGHIDIHDDHCFVDLPVGMSRQMFQELKKVWVCGQRLNISRAEADRAMKTRPAFSKAKPARSKKIKPKKARLRKATKRKAGKAAGQKKQVT